MPRRNGLTVPAAEWDGCCSVKLVAVVDDVGGRALFRGFPDVVGQTV
jgi:hypothetical protein